MYNAAASGFVVNASLDTSGSDYNVGDVLTISGGTGTAMQITVDMVNGSGEIIDFHVSRVGNYSAYPTLPAAVTGGAGSDAEFELNFPAPDYYIDIATPTAPILYVCMTSGSNSSSVWAKISGSTSGSSATLFAITTLSNADYFTALPLTISYVSGVLNVAFGTAVSIAKYNLMRPSVQTALFDGETITYWPSGVSSYTSDNYRTATDSASNTEFEVAYPRFQTAATLGFSTSATLTGATAAALLRSNCVITADNFPAGVGLLDGGSNQIYWQEKDKRVWARQYIQSSGD